MGSSLLLHLHTGLLIALVALGTNTFYLLLLHLRGRKTATQTEPPALDPARAPTVLIQLPLYNESRVVTRLLDAVERIRYPRDRLTIQILDDSTDGSSLAIHDWIAARPQERSRFEHRRRASREGFKAGALAEGLRDSNAEFVAILDADFAPEPDFLERLLPPLLADPTLAFTQARWGFLNRGENPLTRIIAATLNLHFAIEQDSRSRGGYVLNFNGTAGVIRRSAIDRAGGWQGDTLTEDMDLSYRMAILGERGRFLSEVAVPSEIPGGFGAFRQQQERWIQGGLETARKVAWPFLRSERASLPQKIQGALHLTHGLVYPLTLALTWVALALSFQAEVPAGYFDAVFVLWLAFGAFGRFAYIVADRAAGVARPRTLSGKLRSLLTAQGVLFAATAVLPSNSLAALRGIFGRARPFLRTPKTGSTDSASAIQSHVSPRELSDELPLIHLVLSAASILTAARLYDAHQSWLCLSYAGIALGYLSPLYFAWSAQARKQSPAIESTHAQALTAAAPRSGS